MSRNTETIRKGTLLSCVAVKLPVAKTFTDNLEEYQNFPPEVFCLTVPKKQVSESRSVSLFSENETFFLGGLCREFLSAISCLVLPKNFLNETFCDLFQIIPVPKKNG